MASSRSRHAGGPAPGAETPGPAGVAAPGRADLLPEDAPDYPVGLPLGLLRELAERLSAPAVIAEARGAELAEAIRAAAAEREDARQREARRPAEYQRRRGRRARPD